MTKAEAPAAPYPTVDENGVDRSQIRAMLKLTPLERLQRIGEFVESVLELRALNETRTIR